jgi:cobyrinic acid a,c-diamide synthase
MADVVPADAVLTPRLTLGYRAGTMRTASPLGPAGTPVRGHEFHYSQTMPSGEALELTGRDGPLRTGFATPRVLASYLHMHLAGQPRLAEAFVATAAAGRSAGAARPSA